MPSATFTKLNGFVEHLGKGVHNLASNQLSFALSNTAPGSESTPPTGATSACILANVTQIAYTNLSTDRLITTTSFTQTSGVASLVLVDKVLTAGASALPTFRYLYVYNSAGTGVTNPLIGYIDYGSPGVTLGAGESVTADFTDAQTLFDIQ